MLRLKQLREEFNLSQLELAKKLHMTQQRISSYEKNIREPDLLTLQQIANFFGVSTDYLLGSSDKKKSDDILNEALIGMSKDEYNSLTDKQKEQIRNFIRFIKKENE